MRLILPPAAAGVLLVGTVAATAVTCSPGVLPSCIGDILHTAQPYRFGTRRPAIVSAGRPVAAGARYCFSGQSKIGRKLFFYVDQSELMFEGADVKLPTGCRLDTLDTSEPD